MVGVADVHELDEAQGVAPWPEVVAEGEDLAVVHAALDDAVDLDPEAGLRRRVDALEHPGHLVAEAVHPAGGGLVEGVDGDIEPVEARGAERRGLLSEKPAVGRQRDVGDAQCPSCPG